MEWINLSGFVISLGGILKEPIDALGGFVNCSSPHFVEIGKCAIQLASDVGANLLAHIPYIGG